MADPIRQLLSQTSYDTDGSTTVWNFSFSDGYLDKTHVKVQLRDKITGVTTQHPITEANFIGPYQLSLTPAFAVGSELTIYRDTQKTMPIVNFADKAQITELSLDTNARQAIMVAAEAVDGLDTAIDSVSAISAQVQAASDFADAAEASANSIIGDVADAQAAATAATTQAGAASASAAAAAASAASIAGGPVASFAGLTGAVSAAQAKTALSLPADTVASLATKSDQGPQFLANKTNALQSITTTPVVIQFNNELHDTGGCYNPASYRFQPSVAGWYLINVAKYVNNGVTAQAVTLSLFKNGVQARRLTYNFMAASEGGVHNGIALVQLNGSTDYIDARINGVSAGIGVDADPTIDEFSATFVRS